MPTDDADQDDRRERRCDDTAPSSTSPRSPASPDTPTTRRSSRRLRGPLRAACSPSGYAGSPVDPLARRPTTPTTRWTPCSASRSPRPRTDRRARAARPRVAGRGRRTPLDLAHARPSCRGRSRRGRTAPRCPSELPARAGRLTSAVRSSYRPAPSGSRPRARSGRTVRRRPRRACDAGCRCGPRPGGCRRPTRCPTPSAAAPRGSRPGPGVRISSVSRSNSVRVSSSSLAVAERPPAVDVDAQRAVLEDLVVVGGPFARHGRGRDAAAGAGARPAEHRVHPGLELAGAEGLGDEVVGAGLQAEQPVDLVVARGDHHDVGVADLADPAAGLDAVDAGQPEVEGDQVRVDRRGRPRRPRARSPPR